MCGCLFLHFSFYSLTFLVGKTNDNVRFPVFFAILIKSSKSFWWWERSDCLVTAVSLARIWEERTGDIKLLVV